MNGLQCLHSLTLFLSHTQAQLNSHFEVVSAMKKQIDTLQSATGAGTIRAADSTGANSAGAGVGGAEAAVLRAQIADAQVSEPCKPC